MHHAVDEGFLEAKGLTNYWGYNTLGYFAPDARYACTGPFNVVNEFKGMVKALHRAGIEVLLDVVYNHTGEGNHLGPMLSLKGLDPLAYYLIEPGVAALLPGLHRHREQPQPRPPPDAEAGDGLAALLGAGDARRRVPLRPGHHPRPAPG